jgi:hypothetical protein
MPQHQIQFNPRREKLFVVEIRCAVQTPDGSVETVTFASGPTEAKAVREWRSGDRFFAQIASTKVLAGNCPMFKSPSYLRLEEAAKDRVKPGGYRNYRVPKVA